MFLLLLCVDDHQANATSSSRVNSKTAKAKVKYPRIYLDTLRPSPSQDGDANRTVYFLGLFELSTKWGERRESFSEVSAAKLAVKHVNQLQVLPGYNLSLLINDTKVDIGEIRLGTVLLLSLSMSENLRNVEDLEMEGTIR